MKRPGVRGLGDGTEGKVVYKMHRTGQGVNDVHNMQ